MRLSSLIISGIALLSFTVNAVAHDHQNPSKQATPLTPVQKQGTHMQLDAINLLSPYEGVYSAGQLSENDIQTIANSDITTIINLRPSSEKIPFDEAKLVAQHQLNYLQLPISGAADISFENALTLQQAIDNAKGDVMVHCGSGNRVGALLALSAFKQGKTSTEAMAIGKAAGLTRLEPLVVKLLTTAK